MPISCCRITPFSTSSTITKGSTYTNPKPTEIATTMATKAIAASSSPPSISSSKPSSNQIRPYKINTLYGIKVIEGAENIISRTSGGSLDPVSENTAVGLFKKLKKAQQLAKLEKIAQTKEEEEVKEKATPPVVKVTSIHPTMATQATPTRVRNVIRGSTRVVPHFSSPQSPKLFLPTTPPKKWDSELYSRYYVRGS